MVRYRCGRCGRKIAGKLAEDHALNAHGIEPVEIDFSPVPDGSGPR